MRLGLIARCDNRGLGIQSWEFYRHMRPDKTLVVRMEHELSPFTQHVDRYPDGIVAEFAGHVPLDPQIAREFLDGLDVIYTAETFYWYEIVTMAREMGVRTAVQANWEFFRWHIDADLPKPDLFISPSIWHLDEWPSQTVHLPFPVDRKRLPFVHRMEARTFLHVGGARTHADRNGTRDVMVASRRVHHPDVKIRITSQRALPSLPWHSGGMRRVERRVGDPEDYWTLYDDSDVLLLPRRFGGLSLQLNEAASAGMPIISTDVPPQNELLPRESLVAVLSTRRMRVQCGEIEYHAPDPRSLVARIEQLANEPELVAMLSRSSDAYADSISWDTLGPVYRRTLEGLI